MSRQVQQMLGIRGHRFFFLVGPKQICFYEGKWDEAVRTLAVQRKLHLKIENALALDSMLQALSKAGQHASIHTIKFSTAVVACSSKISDNLLDLLAYMTL